MKKKRDIHGIMNTLMGVLIGLVGGIYYSQLPVLVVVTMIFASAFLVIRETWMFSGGVRWSTTKS